MAANKFKVFLTRFLLLGIAVGLLGGMAWIVRARAAPVTPNESLETANSIPVRLHTVAAHSRGSTRSLAGTVQARYETELAFRVAGKIAARQVDVGARVAAGDVLFKLEVDDYELQVEAMAADVASAEATFKQASADEVRMRSLRASRSVSDDEYDQALASRDVASARLTSAQRSLALARNRLSYTTLQAPAAGIVTAILAESGQVVSEGRGVAKIAQGNELEVVVGVPERMVDRLAESALKITYWSLPNATSQTKLRELSPTADPIARTYEARFTIIDAPHELQLGMSATLHLNNNSDGDGIAVPSGSLSSNRERLVGVDMPSRETPIVWKVVDDKGHVAAIPVEVVRYGRDEIIVRGELRDGDRIVSAGVHKLDSGVTVRKWEELK